MNFEYVIKLNSVILKELRVVNLFFIRRKGWGKKAVLFTNTFTKQFSLRFDHIYEIYFEFKKFNIKN